MKNVRMWAAGWIVAGLALLHGAALTHCPPYNGESDLLCESTTHMHMYGSGSTEDSGIPDTMISDGAHWIDPHRVDAAYAQVGPTTTFSAGTAVFEVSPLNVGGRTGLFVLPGTSAVPKAKIGMPQHGLVHGSAVEVVGSTRSGPHPCVRFESVQRGLTGSALGQDVVAVSLRGVGVAGGRIDLRLRGSRVASATIAPQTTALLSGAWPRTVAAVQTAGGTVFKFGFPERSKTSSPPSCGGAAIRDVDEIWVTVPSRLAEPTQGFTVRTERVPRYAVKPLGETGAAS